MYPNVKYELLDLENLFLPDNPDKTGKKAPPEIEIRQELERIKQTLIYEVFNFEDEKHLERYIQYHQQAIIRLMDKADTFQQTNDQQLQIRYASFYGTLNELLAFIERHFTKYFDQDAKAPEGYIALIRKDTALNLKKLHKGLSQQNADPRLINLVLHVLKKIVDKFGERNTTYRKILYAKEMQKELFRLLEKENPTDINEDLRQVIYYLNLNSIKVITYHAHYINELLDKAETRLEKIERLSFVLKNINQAQVKPGIGYNHHANPLKSQLNEFITVEIEYQERLQQLNTKRADPPSDSFLPGFKLRFEASVSQLAYLVRIFIETKIIANTNLSQLMHFLVMFAITKKSESVSYGSFRAKFYNVEIGTKDAVRSMLMTLVHHIDKN